MWALEQKGSRRGWDTGHEQDVLVPWVLKPNTPKSEKPGIKKSNPAEVEGFDQKDDTAISTHETPSSSDSTSQTYQRYYHLYREGELEIDIEAAGGVVVQQGYDRDNWWAICERGDWISNM